MAMKKSHHNLSFLFGLGILCLLYGLSVGYVDQQFSKLTVTLIGVGALSLAICVLDILQLASLASPQYSWRRIGIISIILVAFTSLYIAVNFTALIFNHRIDVTQFKQHTLSKATLEVLENLTQDVKATVFYVGMPPKYLEDLLREYERASNNRITSEIIDPIKQIGYAAQFGDVISGKESKVILQSGSERRDIDFSKENLDEELLNNAIVRVTREARAIYFLTGHGEYGLFEQGEKGLSNLQKNLLANNMIGHDLMLAVERKIPDDCSVLVVAGAKSHLTKDEEQIIKEYLDRGGDALFLVEHVLVTTQDQLLTEDQLGKNPSLNVILKDWGVKIGDDIVVDLASNVGDVGSPATRNYMPHRAIVNNLDYTFFVRPRSISILQDRNETIKVAPLVLTASSDQSWAETNRMLEVKYNEGEDRAGPVPLASVIFKSKRDADSSDTRIIVITDADFLTNNYIGQYSNAQLGLNAINWLSELDYEVLSNQVKVEVNRLNLTSKQKRMVAVLLSVLPAFIATLGMMVWIKQKT